MLRAASLSRKTIASAISSFSTAALRRIGGHLRQRFTRRKMGVKVVVYRARTDGVDADAARREFLSEALGQRRHRGFGRCIHGGAGTSSVRAAMELRLTIAPPRAAMRGATACVRKNMLFAFRFITSSNSA